MHQVSIKLMLYIAPLKTSIAPENQWLEDAFPTDSRFLGDFLLVFGGDYRCML